MSTIGSVWFFIINPVSGGGNSVKQWNKIKIVLDKCELAYTFCITAYRYHAFELADAHVRAGGRKIIIIGGDGTANEVINGVCNAGIHTVEVTLGMISHGTGNDWVRTIGKNAGVENIANSLAQDKSFMHDIGLIEYTNGTHSEKRYFVNIAGLGFDGMVAKKLAEKGGIFNGTKIRYWAAIFRSLLFYKHTKIKVNVDGNVTEHNALSIACGVCKYNGGGLMQLPFAKYDDGILDMTLIGNMSKMKMVLSLPKLTKGSFTTMKEITIFAGKKITIESDSPIFAETDGEYLGETPVTISVLPSAIKILRWSEVS